MSVGAPRASRRIAVFGSGEVMAAEHDLHAEAFQLGRLLGESGYDVVTGGYDGTMAAVSQGANEAGAHVRGITMGLFDPLVPNRWLHEERRVDTFGERLDRLCDDADGYVVMRGGIGTLTELGYVWGLLTTGVVPPRPLILLGEPWPRLLQLLRGDELRFRAEHFDLLRLARSPVEAMSLLEAHFAGRGATSGAKR